MSALTREHPLWEDFVERLNGPEGCDFRFEGPDDDISNLRWTCDSQDDSLPFSRAIMKDMGFSDDEIDDSLAYFAENGGFCDCEVLFNVDR